MKLIPPLAVLCILSIALLSLAKNHFTEPVCNDAAEIDPRSTRDINSRLRNFLTGSTYFSVFSVSLDTPCPFQFEDDAQCVIRECTVKDCSDEEVPPAWRDEKTGKPACKNNNLPDDPLNNVDRSLTGLAALVGAPVWQASDEKAWIARDERATVFVDLRKNPERYTGYAAPSSSRVWEAVYDENCFTFSDKCRSGICDPGTCKEERVLYRLISGLHASISTHIAKDYMLGPGIWGVNKDIYKERIRAYPERRNNLNVAYAVVVRAVSKASSYLHPSNFTYLTGNDDNDQFTQDSLTELFSTPMLQPACDSSRPFDESDMFVQDTQSLLPEFRSAFRNISMIMDCVGCEKCRLWGKLQFLGLGTALRILFEDEMPELERNEVIALINLMYKLSTSMIWVDKMESMVERDARVNMKAGALICVLCIVLFALSLRSVPDKRFKQIPLDQPDQKKKDIGKKPTAGKGDKQDSDSESTASPVSTISVPSDKLRHRTLKRKS